MKVNIGKYPKNGDERKSKVVIESDDLYSLDCTLNLVIAPALHAFISANRSGPKVELKDVPDELWPSNDPEWLAMSEYDRSWKIDNFYFDRWNYILKEMYFAFARAEYPNTVVDNDIDKYDDRVTNGLRLFAKYYPHLWT
jgi:hypothetical protein